MKKLCNIKLFLLATFLFFIGSNVVYAADELKFEGFLTGAQEVTSPAGGVVTDTSGVIEVEFDKGLSQAQFRLSVSNGTGLTQAHLHCASAGVNGPVVVSLFGPADPPVDVGEGSTEGILDNSKIIVPSDTEACDVPVNNIASLAFAIRAGKIYANVHSTDFPNGVARGQLLPKEDDDDDLNPF
ncbi:CHRD domain-containing protein [Nitrosomonas sp. Nm166]|uniref:CHRD domain-containing protein n=1 Tax=Nitrosomonas sp. Nm166 TaxID=1881054 RepID=UPI0008ECD420|nr:CHRD domain-containing protein [Nitrosomonas sp. Nm166]SFF17640.1 CHRD domain-containing protein [Nitrosomonas sp. Nm166]